MNIKLPNWPDRIITVESWSVVGRYIPSEGNGYVDVFIIAEDGQRYAVSLTDWPTDADAEAWAGQELEKYRVVTGE